MDVPPKHRSPAHTLREEIDRDRRHAEVVLAAEIQARLGCLRDDAMCAAKKILNLDQKGSDANE